MVRVLKNFLTAIAVALVSITLVTGCSYYAAVQEANTATEQLAVVEVTFTAAVQTATDLLPFMTEAQRTIAHEAVNAGNLALDRAAEIAANPALAEALEGELDELRTYTNILTALVSAL